MTPPSTTAHGSAPTNEVSDEMTDDSERTSAPSSALPAAEIVALARRAAHGTARSLIFPGFALDVDASGEFMIRGGEHPTEYLDRLMWCDDIYALGQADDFEAALVRALVASRVTVKRIDSSSIYKASAWLADSTHYFARTEAKACEMLLDDLLSIEVAR